jgi:hypothetical protein
MSEIVPILGASPDRRADGKAVGRAGQGGHVRFILPGGILGVMSQTDEPDAVADAFHQLHRAGWSIGDVAFHDGVGGCVWIVSGSHGENLIQAEGETRAEAWARAVEQARSLGMLGR